MNVIWSVICEVKMSFVKWKWRGELSWAFENLAIESILCWWAVGQHDTTKMTMAHGRHGTEIWPMYRAVGRWLSPWHGMADTASMAGTMAMYTCWTDGVCGCPIQCQVTNGMLPTHSGLGLEQRCGGGWSIACLWLAKRSWLKQWRKRFPPTYVLFQTIKWTLWIFD